MILECSFARGGRKKKCVGHGNYFIPLPREETHTHNTDSMVLPPLLTQRESLSLRLHKAASSITSNNPNSEWMHGGSMWSSGKHGTEKAMTKDPILRRSFGESRQLEPPRHTIAERVTVRDDHTSTAQLLIKPEPRVRDLPSTVRTKQAELEREHSKNHPEMYVRDRDVPLSNVLGAWEGIHLLRQNLDAVMGVREQKYEQCLNHPLVIDRVRTVGSQSSHVTNKQQPHSTTVTPILGHYLDMAPHQHHHHDSRAIIHTRTEEPLPLLATRTTNGVSVAAAHHNNNQATNTILQRQRFVTDTANSINHTTLANPKHQTCRRGVDRKTLDGGGVGVRPISLTSGQPCAITKQQQQHDDGGVRTYGEQPPVTFLHRPPQCESPSHQPEYMVTQPQSKAPVTTAIRLGDGYIADTRAGITDDLCQNTKHPIGAGWLVRHDNNAEEIRGTTDGCNASGQRHPITGMLMKRNNQCEEENRGTIDDSGHRYSIINGSGMVMKHNDKVVQTPPPQQIDAITKSSMDQQLPWCHPDVQLAHDSGSIRAPQTTKPISLACSGWCDNITATPTHTIRLPQDSSQQQRTPVITNDRLCHHPPSEITTRTRQSTNAMVKPIALRQAAEHCDKTWTTFPIRTSIRNTFL